MLKKVRNSPSHHSLQHPLAHFPTFSLIDKYGCFILGKGIEAPVFGERNDFHISIYTREDKTPFVLPNESIDELEVTVVGPSGETQFLKPKNNKDGTYNASYQANTPGDYEVAVKLFGKYLKGNYSLYLSQHTTHNTQHTTHNTQHTTQHTQHSTALILLSFTNRSW